MRGGEEKYIRLGSEGTEKKQRMMVTGHTASPRRLSATLTNEGRSVYIDIRGGWYDGMHQCMLPCRFG